jgi:hypothetical protein
VLLKQPLPLSEQLPATDPEHAALEDEPAHV